jgi:hypothetical protein
VTRTRTYRLSGPQKRALRAIAEGRPAASHCQTQSDYGGLHGTMFSLRRHGLLNQDNTLTGLGREALVSGQVVETVDAKR